MPRRLHKGRQRHLALAIARGEVLPNLRRGERQDLRGEVLRLHPGQDEEAGILWSTGPRWASRSVRSQPIQRSRAATFQAAATKPSAPRTL